MASVMSKENEYFSRLLLLIYEKGLESMRTALEHYSLKKYQVKSFQDVLSDPSVKKLLESLRGIGGGKLYDYHWAVLYPEPGKEVTVEDLNMPLCDLLIRYISGLQQHTTSRGRHEDPTLLRRLVRIKFLKNQLINYESPSLTKAEFNKYYKSIKKALLESAQHHPTWDITKAEIEDYKKLPLRPKQQHITKYFIRKRSIPPHPKASVLSKENMNFCKLLIMLDEKGLYAMRIALKFYCTKKCDVPTFQDVLKVPSVRKKLESLRGNGGEKPIYDYHWKVLYPESGEEVTVEQLNMPLTFLLVMHISGLQEPKTFWYQPPDPSDNSVEAGLTQIKFIRNKIVHKESPSLSQDDFSKYCSDFQKALKDIATIHPSWNVTKADIKANKPQTKADIEEDWIPPKKKAKVETEESQEATAEPSGIGKNDGDKTPVLIKKEIKTEKHEPQVDSTSYWTPSTSDYIDTKEGEDDEISQAISKLQSIKLADVDKDSKKQMEIADLLEIILGLDVLDQDGVYLTSLSLELKKFRVEVMTENEGDVERFILEQLKKFKLDGEKLMKFVAIFQLTEEPTLIPHHFFPELDVDLEDGEGGTQTATAIITITGNRKLLLTCNHNKVISVVHTTVLCKNKDERKQCTFEHLFHHIYQDGPQHPHIDVSAFKIPKDFEQILSEQKHKSKYIKIGSLYRLQDNKEMIPVQKWGAATSTTYGQLRDMRVNLKNKTGKLCGMLLVTGTHDEPFADCGDSGAAIMTMSGTTVELIAMHLYEQTTFGNTKYLAIPMDRVIQALPGGEGPYEFTHVPFYPVEVKSNNNIHHANGSV